MGIDTLPASDPRYAELANIRQYCVTKSPAFAGVALLPRYFIINPKDKTYGKEYGLTDGVSIYIGLPFFKESPKAQAFILMHEVLHVALRHPQRGKVLYDKRRREGKPWSAALYNYAVDAIVNFALRSSLRWTHTPNTGIVEFHNLLGAECLKDRPPHTWSAEVLFTYLIDKVIPTMIAEGCEGLDKDDSGGNVIDIESWISANVPKRAGKMRDIADPASEKIPEDSEIEQRNWERRAMRAAAGDTAGGVMRSILFDIKKTDTPWQHILRRFVSSAVMPVTEIKPSRPSKQNIILNAFVKSSNTDAKVPFLPTFQGKPGIRKIVVVADTSGSISDTMCTIFAREMQSLRNKVGCDITLITCDAAVHQIINIKAQDNLATILKNNAGLKGGGGTDFRPGVEAAENTKGAAVIVYLTDMQGPYPSTCRLPLLWASTSRVYKKPPCGVVTVLKLPDEG